MNLSTFTEDKREIVLNAIQQLDSTFCPIYTPPELTYNNSLLNGMNKNIQSIEDKDFPV